MSWNSMLLAHAVLAACVANSAVSSAAAPPLKAKVFYDPEDAANLFKEHVKKHDRKYDAQEYNKRFEIFKESLIRINELNSQSSQAVFEVNFFADFTPEEKQSYYGFVPPPPTDDLLTPVFPPGFKAPDKLDWRDKGVVSPVKHQGHCGSCYIFSAIGNIEGQYALKNQQCLAFSEQQVLDCFSFTCKGGWPHEVMKNLSIHANGCMLEKDYPYIGKDNLPCKEKPSQVAKVLSGARIGISDEEILKNVLATTGPLSVALASHGLNYYGKGIYDGFCNPPINHAVLLVGYGEENGTPYWLLKNSWGSDWGEEGYFRLIRGKHECEMGTSYTTTATLA